LKDITSRTKPSKLKSQKM